MAYLYRFSSHGFAVTNTLDYIDIAFSIYIKTPFMVITSKKK